MHSALFSLNHAIELLLEKALGSGGKSEDQPFSVKCQTTLDVRARGESYIFIVALEFVLAFSGVALLIRYYNHKA